MDPIQRNKWLLLVSSLCVLALLVVAAVQENVLLEWRQIQSAARAEEGPLPVELRQVVNPVLGVADRCVSCHVTMAPGDQGVSAPGMAAHPAVAHDPSEFGCTICHGGQGRATRKADAHGAVEFWPEPMLPAGMAQAGCGSCHVAIGVPAQASFDAAAATFARLDCRACHRVDGVGGTIRPDGGGMEGPDLSNVGLSGFDTGWYEAHLAKTREAATGPWTTSFAPVSSGDRASLDVYLATRVGAPLLVAGKSVFHANGCLGCHTVSGVGGDDGPELTRAGDKDPGRADFSAVPGSRTLTNWLAAHMQAPGAVVAGSQMPPVAATDQELSALTLYTLSLRRRDVPGSYVPRDRMRVTRFGEREFSSDGATLFGAFCTGCHGRDGLGRRVPGFSFPSVANPDFLAVAPDALLIETIARGRPGRRMRAWNDPAAGLGRADAVAVVAYLRARSGVAAPVDPRPARWVQGDRAAGEQIYSSSCAGCHGAAGEGGEGPALDNPVLQASATDTYFVETIARGRRGTVMSGFLEPSPVHRTLTRGEIEAVVTFIRSWGGRP